MGIQRVTDQIRVRDEIEPVQVERVGVLLPGPGPDGAEDGAGAAREPALGDELVAALVGRGAPCRHVYSGREEKKGGAGK